MQERRTQSNRSAPWEDVEPLQASAELVRNGRFDQAVEVLRTSARHETGDWRLHNALGDALLAAGRDEEAIGAFMAAVRLFPGLASACQKIGRVFLARKLAEPAADWLRRAYDCDRQNRDSVPYLAAAEALLGRRDEATALLEAWVDADAGDPSRRHLAIALLGESTPAKAEDRYVTGLFDGYADRFDDSAARLHYCGPELIANALVAARPDWKQTPRDVLDVGCGTGLVGQRIRPLARRLTGVDLSQKMVQKAALRGVYDELRHAEMNKQMSAWPRRFDVVTAADVLTYSGDLGDFCAAARITLRERGLLVVLVEALHDASVAIGYRLNPSGRFAHSEPYIQSCLERSGFVLRSASPCSMRNDLGRPVATLAIAAETRSEAG